MAKRIVYLRLDEEVVSEIDKRRKTEQGEIERSDYVNTLLRKMFGLLEVKESG